MTGFAIDSMGAPMVLVWEMDSWAAVVGLRLSVSEREPVGEMEESWTASGRVARVGKRDGAIDFAFKDFLI